MELTIVQTLTPSIAAGIAGVIFVGFWLATRIKNGGLPYPPGPQGLPLIGNVFDVDVKEPHVTYTKWAEQYGTHLESVLLGPRHGANVPPGGIVYSRIFNQDFVIINSTTIARHLADQRSMVYSDRPQSPLYKLWVLHFTFIPISGNVPLQLWH